MITYVAPYRVRIPVQIPSPASGDLYIVHSYLRICAALIHFFFIKKGIMQLFSADTNVFSKKLKKKIVTKNMKKTSSKVAHNLPPTFFFQYWPGCPNGPKTEIPCTT